MGWLSSSIALGRDPGGLFVAKLGASLLFNEHRQKQKRYSATEQPRVATVISEKCSSESCL